MASDGPKYTKYTEFLFNLARERIRPRGKGIVSRLVRGSLVPSIHPSVFTDIIDYCIPDNMRLELELPINARVVKLDQEKRAAHLKKIASLKSNSYYHLPTHETGLPLPITIKRTRNRTFQLYVEIRDNTINRRFFEKPPGVLKFVEQKLTDAALLITGAVKVGGDTVRIDSGEREFFSLESKSLASIQRMKDAKIVSEIVGAGSQNIDVYTSGFFKEKTKYCVYSRKATISLSELTKRPKDFPLNDNHIHHMMADLLYGLKNIHDKGIVHQDLNLKNILVTIEYGEPSKPETNSYRLKICDFDWVALEGSQIQEATATGGYQSPEILLAHHFLNGRHCKYFFEDNIDYVKQTIGYEQYKRMSYDPELTRYIKPSAANDMFSLGVIFTRLIMRSTQPISLGQEKCLGALSRLCGYRNHRPNIDEAIKIFHKLCPQIPPRPAKPKISILQENIDAALLYLVLEWGEMIFEYPDGPEKTELLKKKDGFRRHLLRLKRGNLSQQDTTEIVKKLDKLRSNFPKKPSNELTKNFLMKIDALIIAIEEKMQSEKKEEVASILTPLRDLRLAESGKTGKDESPEPNITIYPMQDISSIAARKP